MSRELLDKLIELLEQVDTGMIEVDAPPDQLRALHEHAANLEEWARIGLQSKGVAIPPTLPSELTRLRRVEAAALRVASSRRNGIVTDQGPLDALDEALESQA